MVEASKSSNCSERRWSSMILLGLQTPSSVTEPWFSNHRGKLVLTRISSEDIFSHIWSWGSRELSRKWNMVSTWRQASGSGGLDTGRSFLRRNANSSYTHGFLVYRMRLKWLWSRTPWPLSDNYRLNILATTEQACMTKMTDVHFDTGLFSTSQYFVLPGHQNSQLRVYHTSLPTF